MTAAKKLEKQFFNIHQVAELAHCSTRHLQDEIKRGNLRAYKPGKALLFEPDDVHKWIKRKAVS